MVKYFSHRIARDIHENVFIISYVLRFWAGFQNALSESDPVNLARTCLQKKPEWVDVQATGRRPRLLLPGRNRGAHQVQVDDSSLQVEVLKFITPPMCGAEKERFTSAGIQEVTGSMGTHNTVLSMMECTNFQSNQDGRGMDWGRALLNVSRAAHRQSALTDPGAQARHLQLRTGDAVADGGDIWCIASRQRNTCTRYVARPWTR